MSIQLPLNNILYLRGIVPLLNKLVLIVLFAVVSVAVMPNSVSAATKKVESKKKLQDVERALKEGEKEQRALKQKAGILENELKKLRSNLIEAARTIQFYEAEANRLESRLRVLRQQQHESRTQLEQNRQQTSQVLIALGRMARNPPEALIVQPMSPSQTVRSAILLRATMPEIKRRANQIREQLSEFQAAQDAIKTRRTRLDDVMSSLEKQQSHLDELMRKKSAIKSQTKESSARLSKRIALGYDAAV